MIVDIDESQLGKPCQSGQSLARLAARALLVAFLCYIAIWAVSISLTRPLSFDGAMNVQVSRNLAFRGEYVSDYGEQRLFRVQTGAPYLVPVAILFRLFGPTMEAAMLVNAAYLLAFLVAAAYYIILRTGSALAALFCCLLLVLTPPLASVGFGGYGEVPTLFFVLLGIIGMEQLQQTGQSRWAVLLGTSLGLAFLTKTVALIILPALLVVSVYDLCWGKVFRTRDYKVAVGCFLGVVALFELFRFTQLGLGYGHWWREYLTRVSQQAGVSSHFKDTQGLGAKLAVHWAALLKGFKYSVLPLVSVLVLALVVRPLLSLLKRLPVRRISYGEWVLLLMCATYIAWWLAVTPTQKAWSRRVLDGMLLLQTGGVLAVVWLLQPFAANSAVSPTRWVRAVAAAGALLLAVALAWDHAGNWRTMAISTQQSDNKLAAIRTGEAVKSLERAGGRFYGYGWWQAPLISLVAQVPMQNLVERDDASPPGSEKEYLVVDREFSFLDARTLTRVLGQWNVELVAKHGYNKVYRLISPRGDVSRSAKKE